MHKPWFIDELCQVLMKVYLKIKKPKKHKFISSRFCIFESQTLEGLNNETSMEYNGGPST